MPKVMAVGDIRVKKTHKRQCAICKSTEKLWYTYCVGKTWWDGQLRCPDCRGKELTPKEKLVYYVETPAEKEYAELSVRHYRKRRK